MLKSPQKFFADSQKLRALFAILIALVLIYGVGNFRRAISSATDQNYFDDGKLGVTVKAVTKGGASDRAGIQVGDVILSIKGRRFQNAIEADRILREIAPGETVEYIVLREGQQLTIPVTMATIGVDIYLVLLFLTGLASLGTAAFFGLLRPHLKPARLLFASFLIWSLILLSLSVRVSINSILQAAAIPIFIMLFFYARMYFPVPRPDILKRRWLHRTFIFTAFTLSAVIVVLMTLLFLQKIKFNFYLGIVINGSLLFLILVGIGIFFFHRKTKPPEVKRLNRYLKWSGWVVGVTFFAVTAICIWYKIEWLIYGQFALIALILFPLSYLYTTYRFRLLDFNPVIRRSRVYVTVSILINIGLAVILISGVMMLPKLRLNYPGIWFTNQQIQIGFVNDLPPEKREHWKVKAVVVETILFILILWRLRVFLQKRVARKFYQEKYDYKKALAEFSGIVACCLDEKRLSHDVIEKLSGLMRLKNIGIFLAENGKLIPAEASGFQPETWQKLHFHSDDDWVREIASKGHAQPVESLNSWNSELKKMGVSFLAPIALNGRLLGLFVVGEKLSEDHYQVEDLELLEAAASQTAVALENANLYKELKQQERMKNELQIARRIQLGSLPKGIPNIAGLDIFVHSEPATEVGGDFYDFLQFNKKQLMIIVGDVSGKGTSAALYVSKIQGIMRSIYSYHPSPREFFVRLNSLMCSDLEKSFFITQVGGKFDLRAKKLTLVRAGHEPPIHYDARKNITQVLECPGMGMGLGSTQEFAEQTRAKTIPLKRGDIFVFYTDGVTEAKNHNGEEFGTDRLQQVIKNAAAEPAGRIGLAIIEAVEQHASASARFDDLTVCVAKIR